MNTKTETPVPVIIMIIGTSIQRLAGLLLIFLGMYNSVRIIIQAKENVSIVEYAYSALLITLMFLGIVMFYKSFSREKRKVLRKLLNNKIILLFLLVLCLLIMTTIR